MSPEQKIAKDLISMHSDAIDYNRKFSGGPQGAKNFLEVGKKNNALGWAIDNPSDEDVIIAIGTLRGSMFDTAEQALGSIGATCFLADGVIHRVGSGDTAVNVTAKSTNSNRKINYLLNYASRSPVQLVSMHFSSTDQDKKAEYTNLTGELKTVWTTPFKNQIENELELSNYQDASNQSPQFAMVNFIEEGFPAVVSNENFLLFTIKAGTKLKITNRFGLSNSQSQEFYRGIVNSERALISVGAKMCK